MVTTRSIASAAATTALIASAGFAIAAPSHLSNCAPSSPFDRHFTMSVSAGGMAEVTIARLALQNAVDASVRDFAQRMIDDHSKANHELGQLAAREGDPISTRIDLKHASVLHQLSRLSGSDFDRAYMRAMVKDHTEVAAALRRASGMLADPSLRDWTTQTLPTVEDHLRMARQIARKIGA